MNNNRDWNEHIKVASSKISKAFLSVKHAKSISACRFFQKFYLSIVEQHFRFHCSVCGCCGSTSRTQLQGLQNRALRIMTNSGPDSLRSFLTKSLG